MPEEIRPAYARESAVLRLPSSVTLEDLSPEWAWGGATGKGMRVAIIDSGVEADHPALGDCVDRDAGVDITLDENGDPVETPGPHDDNFGHATACAGIIHSFAPEARITSIRVLGMRLSGKAAAFARGLGWAIEREFDVVNLSLGTTKRDWALAFHDLCDEAYFKNVFVVTAANNMMSPSFPSLYSSVTSVACNLATDQWRFHYNPEPPTEFLARGIDVEVPWRGGGYVTSTGNSYAAPHIAGLAALIKSKHPELRPFQLKTVLWATAANVRERSRESFAAGRRSTIMRAATSTRRASTTLRAVSRVAEASG
jgi:subtilisin family serine protease